MNKDSTDLKIHEDINGQVFVKCKEEVTNCPENVLSIMNKGNKKRRIGETNMNERSSRSHTIFRIVRMPIFFNIIHKISFERIITLSNLHMS